MILVFSQVGRINDTNQTNMNLYSAGIEITVSLILPANLVMLQCI